MFKLVHFFFNIPGPKYSRAKALLYVLLSIILTISTVIISYFLWYIAKGHINEKNTHIKTITLTSSQTGAENSHFEPLFFEEVLNLSADIPITFNSFDEKEAKKKLLSTHVIKEATLTKVKPQRLSISYVARVPYVFLADFSNTAMDNEGYLFPFSPFYSPRTLPQVYLGKIEELPWGRTIDPIQLHYLHTLFSFVAPDQLEYIDLSQSDADRAGKREIVLKLKEGELVRLSPKNYVQQLTNYSILRNTILKKQNVAIVDLRVPEIAYLQYVAESVQNCSVLPTRKPHD